MADDNIILEHLRHIRQKVDTIEEGQAELRDRVGRLERNVADLHGDFAGISGRIDRLDSSVSEIRRRLDLAPAE